MKQGQITVFIIIGIIILLLIGVGLYLTSREVTRPFDAARPALATVPQEIQPLKDIVEVCIDQLATDGLIKIGQTGGYIDTALLNVNPAMPTEADAVQFSPGSPPSVAYWWHMKSPNTCKENCQFDSKRPGLTRLDGSVNIESQLDAYISQNLGTCLSGFTEFTRSGCTVTERGTPQITSTVAQDDVFFVGSYPLRANCDGRTFDLEEFYVSIPLNLRAIYTLATNITNTQVQNRVLESATLNLLSIFSGLDSQKLPPTRELQVGPPEPGTYWVKYDVQKKLQGMLASYIPLLHVSGVGNYRYISSSTNARDPELYETLYNRHFFIPLNVSYPFLETRFTYLDWWQPYFELNCDGELCGPESVSNFFVIPITINRYTFSYDLSYPVLVELRDPSAFGGEGYTFQFFLEHNIRNSQTFRTDTQLPPAIQSGPSLSLFCDPAQRTSAEITLKVTDGATLAPLRDAHISYICGQNVCNLGTTAQEPFTTKLPRCVGGFLRVGKLNYATYATPFDTNLPETRTLDITLEPTRELNATIRNFVLTKTSKYDQWAYREGGPMRPPRAQSAVIQLVRNGTPFEEPFTSIVEISGSGTETLRLIPGAYHATIVSFLKQDLVIPSDKRCIKIPKFELGFIPAGHEEKCYTIPEQPIVFNSTTPFPNGGAEFDLVIAPSQLRGATYIEFRQFSMGIENVAENQRTVEDIAEIGKVDLYSTAERDRLTPVIT